MNRILSILLPVALTASMCSCVGAGRIRTEKRPMTAFNIEKKVRVIHGGNLGRNPTGKEIVEAWGQPDRQEKVGKETLWTYNTKPASRGVILFAYLPLPLAYPKGYNGIDFYFKERAGTPWRAVERTTGYRGGYVDLASDEVKYGKLDD